MKEKDLKTLSRGQLVRLVLERDLACKIAEKRLERTEAELRKLRDEMASLQEKKGK